MKRAQGGGRGAAGGRNSASSGAAGAAGAGWRSLQDQEPPGPGAGQEDCLHSGQQPGGRHRG
eukprot:1161383-Pelagomonas_calceolata.AAC.10